MPTSVKMDEETKSKLEALQAEITLATGQKVSQQELLARLVEAGLETKAAVVDSFRQERVPVSAADREAFLSRTSDWGIETSEEEIDELLYG